MLAIGEFAKLVGLTVKTVRLYHEKGLLAPARIDPWTGYRYYDQQCVERARLIVQLRAFDLSLSDVRDILDQYHDEANVIELLENQRRAIELKRRRYDEIVRSLDARIQQGKEILMTAEMFKIERDADRRVAAWLDRVEQDEGRGWGVGARSFTVSSAWGIGGGDALAAVLGKRVAFDVWDLDLLSDVADSEPLRNAVHGRLDEEERAACEQILEASLTPATPKQAGSLAEQLRLALALATKGRAILLEMGGNFLLPSDRAVHVRLVPIAERTVPHHAERAKLSEEAAREDLDKRGRVIESFIRETYGRDVHDPAAYDLVLNSATLDLFTAADLCVETYKGKFSPEAGWWFV